MVMRTILGLPFAAHSPSHYQLGGPDPWYLHGNIPIEVHIEYTRNGWELYLLTPEGKKESDLPRASLLESVAQLGKCMRLGEMRA